MRMNIYVPDDLRKRMDKVKDANWSALACRAFESELAEIAARKAKPMVTQDVLARLRASKAEADSDECKAGREAGTTWAQRKASAPELERLAGARLAYITTQPGSAFTAAEHLVEVIDGEMSRSSAREFWEHAVGDDWEETCTDEFVNGFKDGAIAVWNSVKNQL